MYYISDYKKQAIDKIIPYLIEFPQIVSIIEQSADRYQAIENVLWKIANNFKIDDASGVFLQALAHNENTKIVYTDKADDAFTYGSDNPDKEAYGVGNYYSQISYISGINKSLTDEKTRRAVKAKIIQNNTDCRIEDFLEAIKLYFNATKVGVYESYPLAISLMLNGKNLEISSSENKSSVKNFLAQCVQLKNVYINPYEYDIFMYDNNSSYGDTRYPIVLDKTTHSYKYISQSINLSNAYLEYIEIPNYTFDSSKGNYICMNMSFQNIENNMPIVSIGNETGNIDDVIYLYINENGNFASKISGYDNEFDSNIKAKNDILYNIIITYGVDYRQVNIYITTQNILKGENLDTDTNNVLKIIKNNKPDIQALNTGISTLYTNYIYVNRNIDNFECGNMVFNAMMIGKFDFNTYDIEATQYYVSCYGEKQILFNCIENKYHCFINTTNTLTHNIMTKQTDFHYKKYHSNGKYLYFDDSSKIEYKISDNITECYVNSLNIEFDVCIPVDFSGDRTNVVTDFVSNKNGESFIYVKSDMIYVSIPTRHEEIIENEDGTTTNETIEETKHLIGSISLYPNQYTNFKIKVENNYIQIYQDNKLLNQNELNGYMYDISNIIKIRDTENTYNNRCFIKNLKIDIIGIDNNDKEVKVNLDLPYNYRLSDKNNKYEYTNYGARLITVPQLISDTSNKDLYGNTLIGIR